MTKTINSKPITAHRVRAAFAARVRAANRGDMAAADMKARPHDAAAIRRYERAVSAWRHASHVFAKTEHRYYEISGEIFSRYVH